jgi:hypothetical protein
LLIGLILVTNLNLKAEDAISIQKGQTAPYSGVLFTESGARDLRSEIINARKVEIQLTTEQQKHELSKRIIQLKDSEIELYRSQNKRLERANQASDTVKTIYFGLGILLTAGAVYGAGALSK